MKRTVFIKNCQSDILPKIKFGISGPQGDYQEAKPGAMKHLDVKNN